MRCWMLAFIFVAGCGGEDGTKPADASVDAYESECGHPGDEGNELGVGRFCENNSSGECATTQAAPICSYVGSTSTHFCTKLCQMGSTGSCGTGAECVCNGGSTSQCGCTPSSCLGP